MLVGFTTTLQTVTVLGMSPFSIEVPKFVGFGGSGNTLIRCVYYLGRWY